MLVLYVLLSALFGLFPSFVPDPCPALFERYVRLILIRFRSLAMMTVFSTLFLALTAKTKPAKILICMIYYPDERSTGGWASKALNFLGYEKNPEKIQLLIRKAFHEATSLIRIPGVEVIPVPLYNALNGKDTTDYVDRVEPSAKGGRIMAEYLLDIIDNPSLSPAVSASLPPTTSPMEGRE